MNLGKDETSGVDFALRYAFAPTRLGSFTIGATGTYLDEVKVTLPPGWTAWEDNGENLAGTSEYWGSGQPEWRIVSSLDWQLGNTGASAVMTWFDEYDDWETYPEDNNRDSSDREHTVDSWTSVDFQLSQTFPALMDGRLSLGCINCFDEEPPLYFEGFSGVDRGLHDIRGRSWYARWSQPFGGQRRD